jgi:excisionase family DNA binding protein
MFTATRTRRPTWTPVFRRSVSAIRGEASRGDGPPVVYTITEACQVLKVSRWTLYQLIRSRRLATISIGKRRLVPASAIHSLIRRLAGEEAT